MPDPARAPLVVLDTDVWSHLFAPKQTADPRADGWRRDLLGARVVIATQTYAELLVGMGVMGERRADPVRRQIEETPVAPVDDAVVLAYVDLTLECRRSGHALAQKPHTGDRWIGATAVALGVPLLSGDGIFRNVPGLRLLREPTDK